MEHTFDGLWDGLARIGRDPGTGGYRRHAWDHADTQAREWFRVAAVARDLSCAPDGNGNLWAWWADEGDTRPGVVTGSHLDSVPDGGAYDGALGVAGAFAAVDLLRARGLRPVRPIGIVAFVEEEGSRFGVPCLGSRLLTGALDPRRARGLTAPDGTTYAEALARAGHDLALLGPDPELLARIGTFVELHVEQGRVRRGAGLADLGVPVGLADGIWPHGRWRFGFDGAPDHAGTAPMGDRHDPMLTYAMTVLAANKQARAARARATFGRVEVHPNGTNAVPARIEAWLDARAPVAAELDSLVDTIRRQAADRADRDGTRLRVEVESRSPAVTFDRALVGRLRRLLGDVPVLATAAGHDAGILASAGVPATMIFVRNPSGVSHAPTEFAERADCLAGVGALARVLADLVTAG